MENELACINSEAEPLDSISADWVEVVTADKQVPKRIFLSHSGAQKDFVEQLCEDLERAKQPPFFDKRLDSLPKGEKFAPLIFTAIQNSEVAVVVVSEEYFTKSKWPMLELAEIVQGARCKILPLFYGLSCEEYKNLERREQWFRVWDEWSKEDDRICLDVWQAALRNLDGTNGMEYVKATGEVTYRRQIATIVCDMMQQRSVPLPEMVVVDINECDLHRLGEDTATSKFKLGVSPGCYEKVFLLQVVVGLTMLLLLCGYDHFHYLSLSRSELASVDGHIYNFEIPLNTTTHKNISVMYKRKFLNRSEEVGPWMNFRLETTLLNLSTDNTWRASRGPINDDVDIPCNRRPEWFQNIRPWQLGRNFSFDDQAIDYLTGIKLNIADSQCRSILPPYDDSSREPPGILQRLVTCSVYFLVLGLILPRCRRRIPQLRRGHHHIS